MVKPQNKTLYHPSSSRLSKSRSSACQKNPAKRIILIIIALASLTVIIATVLSFLLTKEFRIKSQITHLATDYYENYFYTNLTNSTEYQNNPNKLSVMEKYHTYGLARTTLNNLLLYDNERNASYSDYLSENCDLSSTYVRIFPDPPYEKNSYHIDYYYSCDF